MTVSPKPVVCSINGSKNVVIPLGAVDRTAFSGVGSPGGPVGNRNISVNCPQDTTVKLTVDGNPGEPGYGGSLLGLNKTGSEATGVAVQLNTNGRPIVLKTPLGVGSFPSGISNIPISANYVQTKPVITSGGATASATYTLTYE
ncbi:fimbrial protein [Pseudomonas sp. D47]|uniref:fimbrial protein n=1 Tax=Pseudomonas sp. D47 TaxID=3159447 RepID=UPI00387B529E